VTVYQTTKTTLWGTPLGPVTCCINHFHTAFTRWKTEQSLCISDRPASNAVLSNCTHSCHDWADVIHGETVTVVNIHITNSVLLYRVLWQAVPNLFTIFLSPYSWKFYVINGHMTQDLLTRNHRFPTMICLSTRRTPFKCRKCLLGFLFDKVILGQDFMRILRFFHCLCHSTNSLKSFSHHWHYLVFTTDSVFG
jgi:hypothetical protein